MSATRDQTRGDAPHFLILVPTLDRNDLLNETLASVFAQRYMYWTLLVSDNGSTVPVAGTIPAHFLDDPRLHLVRRPRLRTGTEHAEILLRESLALDYDYFVLLADDDLFLPETLDVVVKEGAGAPIIATAYATWEIGICTLSYSPAGASYRVGAIDEACRLASQAGAYVPLSPGDPCPRLGPTHVSSYFVRKTILHAALARHPWLLEPPFGDVSYGKLTAEAGSILYLAEPLAIIRMGANYGMAGALPGQRYRLAKHHSVVFRYSPLRAVTFANMALESYLALLHALGLKPSRGVSIGFLRRHVLEILRDEPWDVRTYLDLVEALRVLISHWDPRTLAVALRRRVYRRREVVPVTVAGIRDAAQAIAHLSAQCSATTKAP